MLTIMYRGDDLIVSSGGYNLYKLRPGDELKLKEYKNFMHDVYWEVPNGVLELTTIATGGKDWYGNEKRDTFFIVK